VGLGHGFNGSTVPCLVYTHCDRFWPSIRVQSFYAWRTCRVSQKSLKLNYILGLLILLTYGSGFVSAIQLFLSRDLDDFNQLTMQILTGLFTGFAALHALLISAFLFYFLSPQRNTAITVIADTRIERLKVCLVGRGLVITVTQLIFFVTFIVAPSKEIWLPIHTFIGKIYINDLLAMLNYREFEDGKGRLEGFSDAVKLMSPVQESSGARPISHLALTNMKSNLNLKAEAAKRMSVMRFDVVHQDGTMDIQLEPMRSEMSSTAEIRENAEDVDQRSEDRSSTRRFVPGLGHNDDSDK